MLTWWFALSSRFNPINSINDETREERDTQVLSLTAATAVVVAADKLLKRYVPIRAYINNNANEFLYWMLQLVTCNLQQ